MSDWWFGPSEPGEGGVATMAAAVMAGRLSAAEVLAGHVRRHEATHPFLNALVQPANRCPS